MTPESAVELIRQALVAALWISAPLLIVAFAAGMIINILQIASSMQDSAFSTIPRLAVFLVSLLLLLPWMLNRMMTYTTALLGDLSRYAK